MTSFLDLTQALQLALKTMSMYTAAHPRSAEALRGFQAALETWLSGKANLQVVVSNGVVFAEGQPVEGLNVHVKALARQFVERSIAGVTFLPGATVEECQAFLQVLLLKPVKLDEQGGVAKVFQTLGLQRIQLTQTQYREIREGEPEGDGTGDGAGEKAPEPAPEPMPNPLDAFNSAPLVSGWLDQLHASILDRGLDALLGGATPQMPWDPPFSGAHPPADLSDLGTFAERQGWGATLPSTTQLDAFRQALMELDGARQLAVLMGQGTLPSLPPALRTAFQALAPEVFACAASQLIAQGAEWDGLRGSLYDLLRTSQDRQTWLEVLAGRLQEDGLGLDRVDDLVRQMDWDGQTMESQVRRMEDPKLFWELTLEQRLAFLRRLLEQGRTEAFLALLDHLVQRLSMEQPGPREAALRTLAALTHWLGGAAFPHEGEGPLLDGLKSHLAWEPLAPLQALAQDALGALLASLARRGELMPVMEVLQELRGLASVLGEDREDLRTACDRLPVFLCAEAPFAGALAVLQGLEPAQVPLLALPYFEALGRSGASALMAQLSIEPDRRRRGRIMEVMRGLGADAVPAIQDVLHHGAWYVVRNALNLLSELGHAGLAPEAAQCLLHPDPRVRQAAVRALWKLGGPSADGPLLDRLPSSDPDTQMEILFGLGQIQSLRALPVLLTFAAEGRTPERLRVKALEVIGLLGRPESLGPLADLVRRKGRIFTSAEPQAVRLAAARALLATRDPRAPGILQELVQAEPRGADRDVLLAVAQGSRA